MKKRTFIFCFVLLVCLFGLWCLPRKVAPSAVVAGFLGFTNSGGHHEALFALSNPPNAAVSLHSVRRVSTLTNIVPAGEAGHFSWAGKEEWGLPYAISVNSTNEPLCVVFQFQQRAVGPRRIVEQIRELWGRLTRNECEFFTGSIFFVTNETEHGILPR
jgi:hypothetical protein